MVAPVKKRAARKSKQTLNEFKAWLEGVEELQPDAWAPNHDQWVLIRKRIGNIVETIQEEKPIVEGTAPVPVRPQNPQNPIYNTPVVPSSIPNSPVVPSSTSITQQAPAQIPAVKGKTPNIDTTDGNYESSFE